MRRPQQHLPLKLLREYYRDSNEEVKRNLEKLLTVTFETRYEDVCDPSHWGQLDNAVCLATIYNLHFKIASVTYSKNMRMLHNEEVTGRMRDGRRLHHLRQMERILVYINKEAHYGVVLKKINS